MKVSIPAIIAIALDLIGATNAQPSAEESHQTPTSRANRQLFTNVFDRAGIVASDDANSILTPEARIVGGVPAAAGKYPSYVHVASGELCGGTLIWPDVVLTAAHCRNAWSTTTAFIGSTVITGQDAAERATISRISPHPRYTQGTEENDIMLVLLAAPSSAPLVTLNRDPARPVDRDPVTVIGFGLTSEDGAVSQSLLEVELEVFGIDRCRAILGRLIFPETHVCAGVAEGGRDSCRGDSGGPLLDSRTGVQYGLVSFGVGCARPNSPGVYTDVSAYATFIDDFICQNSASPPASCRNQDLVPTQAPTSRPIPETRAPTRTPTRAPINPSPSLPTTVPATRTPSQPVNPPSSNATPGETASPSAAAQNAADGPTGRPTTAARPTLAPGSASPNMNGMTMNMAKRMGMNMMNGVFMGQGNAMGMAMSKNNGSMMNGMGSQGMPMQMVAAVQGKGKGKGIYSRL